MGAPQDSSEGLYRQGAVYILFLDRDGTARTNATKITQNEGIYDSSLSIGLNSSDSFGMSVAGAGMFQRGKDRGGTDSTYDLWVGAPGTSGSMGAVYLVSATPF